MNTRQRHSAFLTWTITATTICAVSACHPETNTSKKEQNRRTSDGNPQVRVTSDTAPHPLDALSANEIIETTKLLKLNKKISDTSRFASISLLEPPKETVASFVEGQKVPRKSFSVIYEITQNKTFEAIVDLTTASVVSYKEAKGQSQVPEDVSTVRTVVKSDPLWQSAMRKRGIDNFDEVYIAVWAPAYLPLTKYPKSRILKAVFYNRGKIPNAFFRPIEGVVCDVDVIAKKITKLADAQQLPAPAIIDAKLPPEEAAQAHPGIAATYKVNGSEVTWKNWKFRFAVQPREGLVLYTVSLKDGERYRPVLYRGSVSELCVPYGDPDPAWSFRDAFDVGQYGLGTSTASLQELTDAPANAKFFDAIVADQVGAPVTHERAVALFERDGGILWKHFDRPNQHNLSVRGTDLVLSYVTTLSNYDYCFNWIFHEDGSLEMETGLTGVMLAKGISNTASSDMHGHVVQNNIEAVHHQHFFSYRLDMDVDGADNNSVIETNNVSIPQSAKNPYGNAFCMQETTLPSELSAKRQLNFASTRRWKVINESKRNALGGSTGIMLVPGENGLPYAASDSFVRQRAGFLNAPVWVTPYDTSQMFAAGDYPFQSGAGDGLPTWTRADRSIKNKDIVLWYTMGITHTPRPEEWPIMPVHRAGFKLIPNGFFAHNPTIDYGGESEKPDEH